MDYTLLLAAYGALVSTALGIITVITFIKQQRTLFVDVHPSFAGDQLAYYDFIISNVSSQPITIIDCMIMNLAKTERGKLEPDWGIEPYALKSLFGDRITKRLALPHTLAPGGVLIVGTDSNRIIEQFSFYARTPIESKKWTPTDGMQIEINHSMSKKEHLTKFKLEEGELSRLHDQNSA